MPVPETMRVPLFRGEGRIEWAEKPVPAPGAGQLLLRSQANSLCGSDRHQFYHGSRTVPGHEAAGVVVATGSETNTAVGTPGVVFLMDFCGECRNCRAGYTNLCQHKRADMGFTHDGGFAEYMVIHENIFFPVDADIPPAEATLLLDIMGTGGHAMNRALQAQPVIESLLISGAGPIGLGVLAMARTILGPQVPIFITDLAPYRLDLGERLGGIPIDVRSTPVEEALGSFNLAAVDAAIDTTGKTVARQASIAVVGKPGVFVCVGHGETLTLDVSRDLIAPQHAVLGSEYFPFALLQENLERLRANREYFGKIITHRIPVADVQHAYELFFAGETGKVIAVHDDV